jgi:hypothetical protein
MDADLPLQFTNIERGLHDRTIFQYIMLSIVVVFLRTLIAGCFEIQGYFIILQFAFKLPNGIEDQGS